MTDLLSQNTSLGYSLILLLGLIAGVMSGLLGIGGAVLMIPALVLGFGISQHTAQGTTLAMMLPPVTLLAVMQYHKNGNLDWRIASLLCLSFFIGGLFGAKIANAIHPDLLKRIFGIALLLISLKMIFSK